ncbi:MAG TPA: imidazolonepropionase [Candidatus Limnocylindria bacterium]|nr:imidazolonepropionase [Candidatus Limnocylindria bacterium]
MLLTGSGRLAPGGPSPWAILVEDGRIAWIGDPADAPADANRVDLGSALVTPGLVDAHTHPVFAGDRSDEAAARLAGAPYTEGGILRTARATRAASDEVLESLVRDRLRAALAAGTTTVEAKSGYGLTLDEELRHLRILRRIAGDLPIRVVPTFLGAHAVPPETGSAAEHARRVADEMIPTIAAEGLATFVDVFADAGFFGLDDVERIAAAAASAGMGVRLHAEQLARTGATEAGVRLGAASVDHLEQLDDAGVAILAGSSTVATLLPAPAVVLRSSLPPARALLDAGATVALASDANAGTYAGFGTMPLVVGLGATLLRMTVEEALVAATAAGAAALRLPDVGRLEAGAVADLVAWDAEHEGAFALRLGAVRPLRTWVGGREVTADARLLA